MSQVLVQRAAATIIKQEKLIPSSVYSPLSDERLLIPIRKHVRSRSPLALAKIVISVNRPIDVHGFEFPDGRAFLREAAALVILTEIEHQLVQSAPQVPRVAVRVG